MKDRKLFFMPLDCACYLLLCPNPPARSTRAQATVSQTTSPCLFAAQPQYLARSTSPGLCFVLLAAVALFTKKIMRSSMLKSPYPLSRDVKVISLVA
ncbi:hypothetical protein VTL71DRAFT_8493 [Oculimacula yallundae]|uniref:Uncharacterized protein n=1 Tax=Oculimacula yallundae TaxID=86028 RepID=A0ABR4CXS6_9HELO